MTAQRYPADYNGILGGDPAHDRTHTHVGVLWLYAQLHKTATSGLTSDQVALITNSVLNACVVKSGGVPSDTFLTNPGKCAWSPSALLCKGTGQSNCLTAEQVSAVKAIYAGPRDPVTGAAIFPGSVRGSENASMFGWNSNQSSTEPPFDSLFKWVFGLQWQSTQFDYHQSMKELDQILATKLNATNTNLTAFQNRKGKLLLYHGWADPLVAPLSTVNYFNGVVKAQGNGKYDSAALRKTQAFFRLFMVPGMNHCSGGPGPNAFGNQFGSTFVPTDPPVNDTHHHALSALIDWVEHGKAPNQIIATKYVSDLPSQASPCSGHSVPIPRWPITSATAAPTRRQASPASTRESGLARGARSVRLAARRLNRRGQCQGVRNAEGLLGGDVSVGEKSGRVAGLRQARSSRDRRGRRPLPDPCQAGQNL
jgi:feruloyl esterase